MELGFNIRYTVVSMDLNKSLDLKDLWHQFKAIFVPAAKAEFKIEPISFEDGLLLFKAEGEIQLGPVKVYGPTKRSFIEVDLVVLSYDSETGLYRGKLKDETFSLDAMQVNRRKEFRLDTVIRVTSPELLGQDARTEDISLNGARIRIDKKVKVGEYITVDLHIGLPSNPKVSLRAEIKWCSPTVKEKHHCGLRFLSPEKQAKALIKRFIQNKMTMG